MDFIAQGIGIVAMMANILSYQFKVQKSVLAAQMIGAALFAVNMLMLDAVTGGLLNILAVVRALVYMRTERFGRKIVYVNWAFALAYILSYVLTFTVFGQPPTAANLIIEGIPIVGMIAMNIGFSKGTAKAIRCCGFINSPCWLVYNCIRFTLGAIICESISLISIISAYIRLDRKGEAQ